MPDAPFHLAFPVDDLAAARAFYGGVLGASEGRSAERWVDFDFWGHQITAHLVDDTGASEPTNAVDQHQVPARHFGLILAWDAWHSLARHLRECQVDFLIEPDIRFRGEVGEQATMFVRDPAGNALEFKSFRDAGRIFQR